MNKAVQGSRGRTNPGRAKAREGQCIPLPLKVASVCTLEPLQQKQKRMARQRGGGGVRERQRTVNALKRRAGAEVSLLGALSQKCICKFRKNDL